MSKHQPTIIRAHMKGPIALNEPLHLDGLVMAARFNRFGDAYFNQPLAEISFGHGVYQASVGVLIVTGIAGGKLNLLQRTRGLDMKGHDGQQIHFEPNAKIGERTIGPMSPYRKTLMDQTYYSGIKSVVWQVLGDAEALLDLLNDEICTLGKMHATGWGAVEGFDSVECGAEEHLCGLVAGDKALRNIEVAEAEAIGANTKIKMMGRLLPPYALPYQKVRVTGPILTNLLMSESQAKSLLSY